MTNIDPRFAEEAIRTVHHKLIVEFIARDGDALEQVKVWT